LAVLLPFTQNGGNCLSRALSLSERWCCSLVVPSRDERTGNAAAVQPQRSLIPEGCKDGRCTAVRRLLGSVRSAKFDPVGHEQDHGRMRPDWFEPFGLGARMQKRNAMAVLRQTLIHSATS
jgi:hypothetical protein